MITAAVTGSAEDLPSGLADDLATASLALARRISAGATMWCASPSWPHHAQHVAVEFVHPVIVGKPAVPAVALPPTTPTATARANAAPGDVLVVIGAAHDAEVRDLLRRAPAWGVMTVWVGAGERPDAGSADHVLWLPDPDAAPYDGRFILVYHLLWELSHVCLEHAGLLRADPACDGPVCVTCADEGRLAEVVRSTGTTAHVRTGSGTEDVDLSLVGEVAPLDLLVVHAGMAITRLDGAP
jgi:hydrogenase maturation factor